MSVPGLVSAMRIGPAERMPLALVTLLSGVLALVCLVVGAHAVQYDFETFGDPTRLLAMREVDLASVRAFLFLDMFGYYLFLAPIVFASHRLLATRTPWSGVITFSGGAYVLIGAMGASILAAAWPSMIAAHAEADEASAVVIRASFVMITDLVYGGLWNLLEVLLAGVWWIGLGVFLSKTHPKLAWLTIITGVFPLLDGVAGMLALPALQEVMLNGYLVTGVVWPIVIGAALVRDAGYAA
ncbi:MAG: hypothetical protein H5U40_10645 [Polyangiaceae bacterium]|nr:hypothetical protein [Polyangiaceae bacterium]